MNPAIVCPIRQVVLSVGDHERSSDRVYGLYGGSAANGKESSP